MDRNHPQTAAGERASLEQFLDKQRATMLSKAEGLTTEQLRQRIPTSTLSLGGLLKHLALVEDDWIQVDFLGKTDVEPWASVDWDADADWDFHSADLDEGDDLRALYEAACARSRAGIAAHDLDTLAVAKNNRDGSDLTLRWILLHLIEETARHAGHADLLREAIDGAVGEW